MTRWYKDRRTGTDAVFLEPEEIEATMEAELEKGGFLPLAASPVVKIDLFIESHLKAPLDQYADLPADVLGMTEFDRNGKPRIRINRDLSDALDGEYEIPGMAGRQRATLAHEAAHVILHRFLFAFDPRQFELSLSSEKNSTASEPQRCLKRDAVFRAGGSDWKEVQANMGMAALLMPRRIFRAVSAEEIGRAGIGEAELEAGTAPVVALARALSKRFDVSREAARIRLETLKIVRPRGAGALSF